MDEERRKEAAEVKNLPFSLLEHLPSRKWRSPKVFVPTFILITLFAVWSSIFMFMPLGPSSNFQHWLIARDLNHHENLWNTQNITSYEYSLRSYGFFVIENPALIRVDRGSAIFSLGDDDFKDLNAVPKLFKKIRTVNEKPYDIKVTKVTYDPSIGYPTSIIFDMPTATDSNHRYTITDFKILESGQTSD
ncbi:MAG: DUF6174 domain-containing protein [Dehalococcoidales bacterium]|jgi:hypothetical protein|nr:DUF6174 domain-containing protein [Dehalococcoidales bacterium]MDP6633165.1 DUF6174 domain-containing protein [Dehalococcoidales bacterium]